MFKTMESALANNAIPEDMKALVRSRLQQLMMEGNQKGLLEFQAAMLSDKPFQSFLECKNEICRGEDASTDTSVKDVTSELADLVKKWRETMETDKDLLSEDPTAAAAERNSAANELFSLPELPDGVVGDLARMFRSADEDEVWRDYCLQFLGSALEREDGVTDEDRALARETLVEALASTNATFAGTALRALHRGDPADPLVASNALRIARDPAYPSASRTAALLILEECTTRGVDGEAVTPARLPVLRETAAAVSADPSASSLLRQTAEAVLKRIAD